MVKYKKAFKIAENIRLTNLAIQNLYSARNFTNIDSTVLDKLNEGLNKGVKQLKSMLADDAISSSIYNQLQRYIGVQLCKQ